MTTREAAITAVIERLAVVGTFTVTRNEVTPATIGDGGHVVVRDGVRVGIERTLGLSQVYITHRIGIEALAGGGDPAAALDALVETISERLGADPTLGGTVLFSTLDLDDIEAIGGDGAATIASALLAFDVEYVASDALD